VESHKLTGYPLSIFAKRLENKHQLVLKTHLTLS